jgi:RNA 2',3'-cyclic 3'-phosphodiesterase
VSSSRIRLFIAVSIPEPQLTTLEQSVEPLRSQLPDARWAALANQHVTLKFLGWTDGALIDDINTAMTTVASQHEAAEVSLSGFDAFPNRRRARVVWAGIDDGSGLLTSLALSLDEVVEPLGFERESRPFTPHLTIARIKQPKRVNLEEISVRSDPWRVSAMELFQSHLSPRGARYEVITSAALGGAVQKRE